jgi:RNA polymerase sigma-70 factor, ECF subfamily
MIVALKSGLCGTLIYQGKYELKMLLAGGKQLPAVQVDRLGDNELVALTLSGQKRAFEGIVRRYQKLVYNMIYQMVRCHETAADLTQDTFLKAYKSLGSFRDNARLKPWLLKIASNSALNQIRDSKNRYFDSLEELLEESPHAEPANAASLEDEVEFRFSQASLLEALQRLSPRHRQVFVLRYQHDLPCADIAAVIDESESAVKSMLFRIREKLRKMLLEEQRVQD